MFAAEDGVVDHAEEELFGGAAAEAVDDAFNGADGDVLASVRSAVDEGAAFDLVGEVAFFFQAA